MLSLTRRDWIAVAGATVIAAGCVSLGLWQLDRLKDRRAHNKVVEATMRAPAVPLVELPGVPKRLMRVTVTGVPDYAHEFALTGRTRNGSPGVHLITPLKLPGSDTAILVNRGWVYSPDAAQVDFAQWKERDTLTVSGYVDSLVQTSVEPGPPVRQFRRMDYRGISAQMPYPIPRYYIVALEEGTTAGTNTPVRLPLPSIEEGPHKSYAIQWFSFAAIALLGTAAYLASSRTRRA